mmetsp:Transcript_9114/g.13669  ORF Transcript_9114/g.13669 Transcript_9114/m.13669 type:complete len:330 (-) Transcript_9114:82-1071(-)
MVESSRTARSKNGARLGGEKGKEVVKKKSRVASKEKKLASLFEGPSHVDKVSIVRLSVRPQRLRSRNSLKNAEGTRIRVKTACTNCKMAKARCDNGRPCSRCVKRGCERTCVDAVPKRRGRKRSPEFTNKTVTKTEEPVEEETPPEAKAKAEPQEEKEEIPKKHQGKADESFDRLIHSTLNKKITLKTKRRKLSINSKRLDYLVKKDTYVNVKSVKKEEQPSNCETPEVKSEPDDDSFIQTPIAAVEPPVFFVRSPSNTLSDKEFDALFLDHYPIEQSTPLFGGVLPNPSDPEMENQNMSAFHLSGSLIDEVGISPTPIALNSLWNESG